MSNFSKLRNTHPNLFFAIIVFGLWGVFTGLNFLLTEPAIGIGNFKYVIGTAYLIFGSCKLAGLVHSRNIQTSRLGMIGCMVLSSLISLLYFAFFFTGNLNGLQGAFNFLALGIVQLAAISEPSVNPLTMKRESNE